jgi:hypothetical protein
VDVLEPTPGFFVNHGIVSTPADVYHIAHTLLRRAVVYRYLRGSTLVSWGTGRVDRVVIDRPDISTYFTPVSICINVGSFEYLEFDVRPEGGLLFQFVQGDERVVLTTTPGDADTDSGIAGEVQPTLDLIPDEYVQLELRGLDTPLSAQDAEARGDRTDR